MAKKISFLKMAKTAREAACSKKGENIILLDVKKLTVITNYFLFVTVNSTPQINAVSDAIHDGVKKEFGVNPLRREGYSNVAWRVIDYGGLVIHVMSEDLRELYNIEKIWHGAKAVK